ncbi:hypothetical protein AMECASPLE_033916 [Ameca splendens]|uniref:Uncharacterized protein n=1 Tax=Ameca splendens TaxID=208324 RepID=A0ABV0XW85_9TELE
MVPLGYSNAGDLDGWTDLWTVMFSALSQHLLRAGSVSLYVQRSWNRTLGSSISLSTDGSHLPTTDYISSDPVLIDQVSRSSSTVSDTGLKGAPLPADLGSSEF